MINEIAREALGWFHQITRGNELIWVKKDGCLQWVQDMVYVAHNNGDMLPDDYRYTMIVDALGMIDDMDGYDDPAHYLDDYLVPIYNHDLLKWLSSHAWRYDYVNQAVNNGFVDVKDFDLMKAIQCAYYLEMEEVYFLVLGFLEKIADEREQESA